MAMMKYRLSLICFRVGFPVLCRVEDKRYNDSSQHCIINPSAFFSVRIKDNCHYEKSEAECHGWILIVCQLQKGNWPLFFSYLIFSMIRTVPPKLTDKVVSFPSFLMMTFLKLKRLSSFAVFS